jgi:hypothetical protein
MSIQKIIEKMLARSVIWDASTISSHLVDMVDVIISISSVPIAKSLGNYLGMHAVDLCKIITFAHFEMRTHVLHAGMCRDR